jgi:hypothetical protein
MLCSFGAGYREAISQENGIARQMVVTSAS